MLKEKMMKAVMPVKKILGRTGLKIKKYSPEILLGVGIAAGAACVYYAVKGTLKYKDEIEPEYKEAINEIKDNFEEGSEEQKEAIIEAKKTCLKESIKAYAPSAVFGAVSLVSTLASHGILRKREAAAIAAYKALDEAVKIAEKSREDIPEETEEKESEEKKIKSELPPLVNPYARIFEEGATFKWQPGKGYNEMFLRAAEANCNDLLRAQGHLFLNEVYDILGFPRTKEGSITGWVYEDGSYVDFGFNDKSNPRIRAFFDPLDPENNILLNFNVQGIIWDKI